jgi:hypothetical protein
MPTFTSLTPFYGTDLDIWAFLSHKLHCAKNVIMKNGQLTPGAVGAKFILPLSRKEPNKKFQVTEWAQITPNDKCALFNIVLDSKDTAGKHCNLIFAMAATSQLQVQDLYKYEGPQKGGHFDFTGYGFNQAGKEGETTWNKQPERAARMPNPPPVMKQGYSYLVSDGACPVQKDFGKWAVALTMCSKDATYMFPQNTDRCPLGFYVVLTDKPPQKAKRDGGYDFTKGFEGLDY